MRLFGLFSPGRLTYCSTLWNKNNSKSMTVIANSQTGREKLSVAFPTLTLPSINEWMDPSKNVVPEA